MNVQRWMTRTLITCRPADSLQRAAQLLWEHDLGALPVVDGDHKLLGVVTDRDLCMAAFTRGTALSAWTVESAMARRVFSLAPKDSLARAHELMRAHQIRRLPVVDETGVLVGVVTLLDVARAIDSLGRRAQIKAAQELAATIHAIGQIRAVETPSTSATTAATASATTAATEAPAKVLKPQRASKKKPATTSSARSNGKGRGERSGRSVRTARAR